MNFIYGYNKSSIKFKWDTHGSRKFTSNRLYLRLEYDHFSIKLFNVTYKLIKLKAFTYVLATAMKLSD